MRKTKDSNLQNNSDTSPRGDIHTPVVSGTASIILEIESRLSCYQGPPNMVVDVVLTTIRKKLAGPIAIIYMIRDMIQDNHAAVEAMIGKDLAVSLDSIGQLTPEERERFERTGEILAGSAFIDWRSVVPGMIYFTRDQ